MIDKYLNKLEFNIIAEQLVNECHTFVGKTIAERLKPSDNEEKVKNNLSETTEALNLIHVAGSFPIPTIEDLSLPMKRLESQMSLSPKWLLNMANVLKCSRELKTYYKNSELVLDRISQYFDSLYSNLDIEKKIFSSIISENDISDDASPALSSIRRNKKHLELEIKNKLNGMIHSNTYSKYIMDPVVTIRNGRYVIPVKEEYRSQIKGFIHDTSSSGSTLYIEPMAAFEMNNTISNLIIEENKEIDKILENLSNLLYPITGFLNQDVNLLGKLDFIESKAKFSIRNNCTCPEIANFIDFKMARHPLISSDKVVPITVHLGKENFTTLVITGPNTGGKTVTLKTVGLLCAMAQAGLHIPVAEGSSIKVFDNIFADIGDEQSIEESLSTFSSHMTNIVHILDIFTDRSLILVDELGSGTDPIEGANLAISLLEKFHSSGTFTIATTHYHEIKNYCISHDGFENASCEFDIKNLKPTYHLLLGIPGKSNAFAICKQLGIPAEIIDRASSLISKPDTDIETLMKQIYDNRAKSENDKIEIEKNLQQVQSLRKSLEQDYSDKLSHEKEKIEKAKKEAKQILLDAKDEANSIINQLTKMNETETKKANDLRNKLNKSIQNAGGDGLDLSVLLKLNNKEPSKANSSNGININNSKVNNKSNKVSKNNSRVYVKNNKSLSVSAEINLLGETVDSAISILDKYFDNCVMAHLHQVRIIHGKGTGQLRQGIHQYLKTCKYVDSSALANFGEGDYGVTIVNLK